MTIGRTVLGPKVPTLKGTEASLSYVQCFFYLGSCSINASIFHITRLDNFQTDLVYSKHVYKLYMRTSSAYPPSCVNQDPRHTVPYHTSESRRRPHWNQGKLTSTEVKAWLRLAALRVHRGPGHRWLRSVVLSHLLGLTLLMSEV